MMFRVLIIDDDIAYKTDEIIRVLNETFGDNLEIEYEPELLKARKLLVKEYFDVVVLDVQLPCIGDGMKKEGGLVLLEEILSMDKIKKPLSIIGITSHDENFEDISESFNKHLFHLIKFDRSSIEWKDKLCQKIEYVMQAKESLINNQPQKSYEVDCAFITAVPIEFEAVKRCCDKWEEFTVDEDPTIFLKSEIELNDKKYRLLLAKQNQMGMVASSILSTKIISYFSPKLICMLGIAAGRKGEVELGNIVVASESWDYGSGKIKKQNEKHVWEFQPDTHPIQLPSHIKEFFNIHDFDSLLLEIRKEWNQQNSNKMTNDIELKLGPIVSGSAVVQDDSIMEDYIIAQNRKVLSLDMETYAVYYAATNVKKHGVDYLSIKTVCDYADGEKNDNYQAYAAYVSAKFFFKIIDNLIEK